MELVLLVVLFFIIAMIYSSAGFGGGSSYLALLSLYSLPFTDLRVVALTCNITVVLFSVLLYQKEKQIPWQKVVPILVFSIPLAYLGGRYHIDEQLYFVILAMTLLVASLLMLRSSRLTVRPLRSYTNGLMGGGIGFLSGVVGIGGGIFLSPLLYLTRWDKPKAIAATSSIFILFNSVAGLLGQMSQRTEKIDLSYILPLMLAVLIGGQIGTRLSLFKLDPRQLKKITAVVILLVALRLLWKYLI